MKKIIYTLFLGFSVIALNSCDYNDPNDGKFNDDPSTGWVEFSGTETSRSGLIGCGGESKIEVPIVLKASNSALITNAPVNKTGININYTITDVLGNAASQGVVVNATVPAGSREGKLVVDYPDNLASSLEFLVTLTSTDKAVVQVGAPGNIAPVQYRIKINVGDRDVLTGNYTVVEDNEFVYDSVVTRGPAANELIVSNLYGVDPNAQTRIILNNDGTISFPAPADNFLFNSNSVGPVYLEGLAGSTYEACEGTIIINFRLRFGTGLAGATAPINTVLTRE